MNIGVIGGGATGLMISYYLSMSHDVTLYVRRKEQQDLIIKKGINQINSDIRKFVNVKTILELADKQLIIICVKSTHIAHIINTLKTKTNDASLLFLQNGMGHVPLIQTLNNKIYVGVIEHGIVRENDFTFHHLGKGQIKVSALNEESSGVELVEQLTSHNFPVYYETDWNTLLKEKLIVNAVINPLTALFDVENRFVVENSFIRQLANQLCAEVASVLKLSSSESWHRVKEISRQTGYNTSSMRGDILNKRETEIEAILGYILSLGNHDIPLVKTMYKSVRALQERNES